MAGAADEARAQTYVWGGTGSTTNTVDYETATNWSVPPAGAPPVAAGQIAQFDATGSGTVFVNTAPSPDVWEFTAAAQAYSISGGTVTFGGAGIINNSGNTVDISNQIAGTGGIQHFGGGPLSLLSANTYSGGTLVGPGATLIVGDSAALGTGDLTLDAATLMPNVAGLVIPNNILVTATGPSTIDANGNSLTLTGKISGPGALLFADGTFSSTPITLLGSINVDGGFTVCSCAYVILGSAGVKATVGGSATVEGILDFVNVDTSALTTMLIQFGGQANFLNNTNAGTAVITNDGSELNFGLPGGTDTASAASATINNINGGLVSFYALTSAGKAVIVNDSFGEIDFNNNSTAGSSTILNKDTALLQFFDTASAGGAKIYNEDGGVVIFQGNSTAANATIVNNSNSGPSFGAFLAFIENSNAGSASIQNNAGALIWFGIPFSSDTASAGNATIVNNGQIAFNGFSTASNATIVTNSGGLTNFFDNATGGNARFIINGTGIVDFSATLGLGNDGKITAGSIEGNGGTLFIGGGNTLAVGSNGLSTVFSGVIADFNPCGCGPPGAGNLEKVGAGTLTLLGANTYTGTTTVTAGILAIGTTGSITSNVTVNGGVFLNNGNVFGTVDVGPGGTFGGGGTSGSATISGFLSPGNSIGTLTINGNLVLTAVATYLVEVDAISADRVIVTGTATVAGTVQAFFATGVLQQRYTILTANGGVKGAFGALTTVNLPAGFSAKLNYDPNNTFISLTAVLGGGLPQNQQNVANSLNTFFNAGGQLPARFFELFRLTGANLPNGLNQVTGEIATQASQAAFTSVDYFLNLMLDPTVSGRGGDVSSTGPGANQYTSEANAYAAKPRGRTPAEQDAYAAVYRKAVARNNLFDPRWSVWGAAYGGELKADGNPSVIGSRDASTRAFGFAAGFDYRLSPDTLVGFAMSGGGTNFSLAQGGGKGRSDVFQAGAFVRHNFGQGYVKGAVAYGWHDVTTDRTVAIAGLDQLRGRYNANSFGGRAEAGYRFLTPWMGVGLTPYVAGQAITYFQPGFGDQVTLGLNTFGLNYVSRDVTSARTEVGLRADKSLALQSALLTLRGRAAWAHYFDDDRALTASFQTFAAPAFVVTGAAQSRDAALLSASADVRWMNGISLAGVFEGEFSGQTRGYAGKGIVRYQW